MRKGAHDELDGSQLIQLNEVLEECLAASIS